MSLKIKVAQLNTHAGNINANAHKIIKIIKKARSENFDLVVFPELTICSYPPRDLLTYDAFITHCEVAMEQVANECIGIAAIVGGPSQNLNRSGKKLFNSAWVLENGRVKSIVNKTLLPNYDVFDEYRYFEPAYENTVIQIKSFRIALTICEDLWNTGNFALYRFSPMDELIKQNPDLIINIAASPFSIGQQEERLSTLQENVNRYNLPLLYVNQVGAQTELVFDGNSMAINANGEIIAKLPDFKEDYMELNFDKGNFNSPEKISPNKTNNELTYQALVLGVRDYFEKMGFKKAVIGLSGGVDSALVAVIAAEALGPENIVALMMPSEFSSDHSVTDAENLIENLGINAHKVPIVDINNSVLDTLKTLFDGLPFSLAEENIQSRIRGLLVMAFSNKFGHILLNTSNKSELAVGYGTLYGDMAGGLSVIGDLYKIKVYELCQWINREKEIIPINILTKAPSAELRPDQKDSDSLPEYEILDAILEAYIENARSTDELIALGFDKELVKRVSWLVNSSEYKRYQFAPILRVTKKAFGYGRKMPIEARYLI